MPARLLALLVAAVTTALLLPVSAPANAAVPPRPHVVDVVLALPPGARPDPTTPAVVRRAIGQVDAFYRRVSGGAIRFRAGRVSRWIHVRTRCDLQVARRLGDRLHLPTGDRRHVVVYEPVECPVAGVATVGGLEVLLARDATAAALAHELAHNLGLDHSNSSGCSVAFARVCTRRADDRSRVEYGDTSDLMGGADHEVPGGLSAGPVTGTLGALQLATLDLLPAARVRRLAPGRVRLPVTVRLADRSARQGTTVVVLPWAGRSLWLSYVAPHAGLAGRLLIQTRAHWGTLLLPVHRLGRDAGPQVGDTFMVSSSTALHVVTLGRVATLQLRTSGPQVPTSPSPRLAHLTGP
jgi:hypothetical protein